MVDENAAGPSSWLHRLPVVVFATLGCAISVYLSLYELGMMRTVWEPFFGGGSQLILGTTARTMPVPDAVLGAFAYFVEAIAVSLGGEHRWRDTPWTVALYGLIAIAMAVIAVALVSLQAFLFHAWCTLCLASAVISIALLVPALREGAVMLKFVRRKSRKKGDC